MNRRLYVLVISFILLYGKGYAQEYPHFMDSLGYDSLDRERGYWKLITALNFLDNGKVVKGIEGWEYGFFVEGKKEGGWIVKDNKGKVIGYRIYVKNNLISETQFNNNKVTSIIRSKYRLAEANDVGVKSYGEYVEILIFNKKGKLKKRIFNNQKGKEIIEKY